MKVKIRQQKKKGKIREIKIRINRCHSKAFKTPIEREITQERTEIIFNQELIPGSGQAIIEKKKINKRDVGRIGKLSSE